MKNYERFDELLGLLLDETITREGFEELAGLVAADPARLEELRRQLITADQLGQYEDEQRSAETFIKGLETRLGATEGSREFVEQVMKTVAADEPEKIIAVESIEPELRWLGSGRFWAIATSVVILIGLAVGLGNHRHNSQYVGQLKNIGLKHTKEIKRINQQHANDLVNLAKSGQAFLFAPEQLAPGAPAAFRVFVRNGATAAPVAGAEVDVSLAAEDGGEVWMVHATTDEDGFAKIEKQLPDDLAEGDYQVEATITGDRLSKVTHAVKLVRSFRVMVTTDKPLYQPGQVIHIRSLSLANADMRPVAGRKAVIEVQDAKGNKVFKKVGEASDFGIFAADFSLADQVNTGSYTISATVGDTTSERTVTVKQYTLPKYKIDVTVDKGFYEPGEKVTGSVSAQYTFGKPVAGGKLKLTAAEFVAEFLPFEIIEAELNADGKYDFEFRLKDTFAGTARNRGDAFISLQAEVVDLADHAQKKTRDLIVTTRPIRIEVFPESGTLVQNVENTVYILTAYPDGRPAKTTITLGANRRQVETSAAGIAKVQIKPDRPVLQLNISAEDAKGVKATVVRRLHIDRRPDAFLMRTDRAVYKTGDTVKLAILSPSNKERIFVDVVKNRRAVLMKTIDINNGEGELALDLPADLFGTLELRGYRIQRDGSIIGDTKVIHVKRADRLIIEATLDQETYRPAEKALLNFIVKRANGEAVPAALGLAGVDEAVFALSEMRPGLERVYFAIQEEILKPRYQINARPPVQVQQLIEPMPMPGPEPIPEPDVEEAAVVLFAAAEGSDAPQADRGPNNQAKQRMADNQQRESTQKAGTVQRESTQLTHGKHRDFRTNLGIAAVISPAVILFLLALPLLGYAILKFKRRQPVAEAAAPEARRATNFLLPAWILGINVPVLGVFLALKLGDAARNEAVGHMILGFVLFAVLTAVGLLFFGVYKARRSEALGELPLLRKVLLPLPWVFILAVGGIVAVLVAANSHPRLMDGGTASAVLIGMFALLALTGGAISIARNCAMHKVSGGRMVWLGISRSCLSGASCILLLFMVSLLAGGNALAKMERAAMDGGMGGMDMDMAVEEMAMDGAVANFAVPKMAMVRMEETTGEAPGAELTKEGRGGSNLKAPSRIRRYFPETLLWKPELITDDQGRAKLEVPLADSITTWRLAMSAVSQAGELGSATTGIRVFQDFFVDIDFPVALTQHDEVSVPVAVFNYLDQPQTVKLEVQPGNWFRLLDDRSKTLEIGAGEVTRVYFRLEALKPGTHALTLKAFGSKLADAVERRVRVEPDGKRFETVLNGRLDENLSQDIEIPAGAIDGANDLYVKIYPGAFSQVVEGLDGIFRMPNGCFEQTSSATYPNILVLDYLIRNKMAKPEVEKKAKNFINIGYQRLLSYEVKGGGFEWFGKVPAHNVLTAYGLMEFSDMAKVHDVDPKVIERTRQWLYSKQGNDGSWTPDQGGIAEGAINAFRGAKLRTTAYIAWALAESGGVDRKLNKAIDFIIKNVGSEKDNYTLGLCANALVAANRDEAKKLINRLEVAKISEKELVYWKSESQGVTFGRGNSQVIETTAIIAHAFLKGRQHTAAAHKALAWLIEKKDGRGTWHSTSATVHAMRALLAGTDGGGGGIEKDLSIAVIANGKEAKKVRITPETSEVFRLISLRHLVKAGQNKVTLEPSGKGNLAYQIVTVHYLPWREQVQSVEQPPLTIDVTYDALTLEAGDTLGVNVKVQYYRPGTAAMTLVDLGIPPGFAVMPEFLQALKDDGKIEKYTSNGRQITLYFREISSERPIEFAYELRAKFPVKAKTPKSVAYQYYEPEIRAEAAPVEIRVE